MGMGLSMLAMAAGFSLPVLDSLSAPIALIGTLAYILSFGLGVGPVPALIVPEISPPELRGMLLVMHQNYVLTLLELLVLMIQKLSVQISAELFVFAVAQARLSRLP